MEEEILALVLKYTELGKLADANFIYDVSSIIIRTYNLEDYVKDIKIKHSEKYGTNFAFLGEYIYFKRLFELHIYLAEFKKYFNNDKRIQNICDAKQKLFYQNLFFVEVIRHELEHAYQEYLKEYGQTLESDLIKATADSYCDSLNSYSKMQNYLVTDEQYTNRLLKKSQSFENKAQKYYEYDLKERLAHLKSKLLVLTLSQKTPDYPISVSLNNQRLNYVIYHAYQNLDSPTIYFSKKMHLIKNLELFLWYHRDMTKCLEKSSELYSLATRVSLGLPISASERSIIYNEYLNNLPSSLVRKKS